MCPFQMAGWYLHPLRKGLTPPHPPSFDKPNGLCAVAYAISFKEICDTFLHFYVIILQRIYAM